MRLIVPACLLLALPVMAQETEQPAAPAPPWSHTLVGDVTANQVALKDWAQGGDNSLSWGYSLNGTSDRTIGSTVWSTTYKLAFGQNKLGDQAIRKVVDRLQVETSYTWKTERHLDPYLKGTLKTQSFRGYRYEESTRTAVSDFFDPAYLTQSAGLGVQPIPEAKTRLGAALRQIITRDFNSYADKKKTTKVEQTRFDAGVESVTDAAWNLADNIQLTSKLEIFVPVTKLGDTSIGNDATMVVKLSQYITLNVNLQILKDPTSSDDVQIKQTTALGLRYSLF